MNKLEFSKEKQKSALDNLRYSYQRMDLLIITISSGGLYLCFELIKYLVVNKVQIDWSIKISVAFFVFSIILNFISQLTGIKTNKNDYLMEDLNIKNSFKLNENQIREQEKYDRNAEYASKLTEKLNIFSIVSFLLGIVFISIFFLFKFE